MTFDSEFVFSALPYLVTALFLGVGFGWVYKLFAHAFSSWGS
jgi:hypothetical protein